VTSGTFDDASSLDDWIDASGTGGSIAWNSSGYLDITNTTGIGRAQQAITNLVVGKVYRFSIENVGTDNLHYFLGTSLGGTQVKGVTAINGGDTAVFYFTATSTYLGISIDERTAGDTCSVDNVSVREINPLSVSIAAEGRITYADEDAGSNAGFFNWQFNSVNYLRFYLSTSGNRLGEPRFEQRESDDGKTTASGASSIFKPDVLTPFDISGRYGSTFVNGAVDGVALTAITTPTALPDLSSSDLTLAYDYMGTISEFRVWDKDLGDAGIVEATNPSLEPSLSLTFEGTGTNSFIVNDWSQ
jgi:hypothetical protein